MLDSSSSSSKPSPAGATSSDRPSRLNAQAPEFVPRASHVPPSFRPHYHLHRPRGTASSPADVADPPLPLVLKNGVTEESAQKIINQVLGCLVGTRGPTFLDNISSLMENVDQSAGNEAAMTFAVEYYFSDINLATTDHLMRFINKDAEGYVPVSVVASFKKIKAVISSNSQLAKILQDSAKLVVSEDGKKVRRQHSLTESDLEELQSRIIVAENLPDDHCHQNLMKIFSAVGSVKSIRTCQPQPSNGGASSAARPGKTDSMLFSNKLHAFVEYETVELAEKAVAELNDKANWRSGLRVRLFVRNNGKSCQPRGKKLEHESESNREEDGTSSAIVQPQMSDKHLEDPSQQIDGQSRDHIGQGEEHVNDKESTVKKGRVRGKGKGRGARAPSSQYHHHYHHHNNPNNIQNHRVGTPPSGSFEHQPSSMISKQPPGPRMPDGTRGFSIGRGKPLQIA